MSDDNRRSWPWSTPESDVSSSKDLNKRIMIIATITLSSVVILVISLHIYARRVLARRVNQRREAAIIRHIARSLSQPDTLHSSAVMPKPGLDPALSAGLPTFKLKNLGGKIDESMIECSVCLSLLEDEEMVKQLPNCSHAFHVECIDKWFEFNTNCPLCRAEVEPRALEPSAPPLDIVTLHQHIEATKDASVPSASTSQLSSFRRMLSRNRSSRVAQSSALEIEILDLEQQ